MFKIVSPSDVEASPALDRDTTLDLYSEYPKLTADEVGDSNKWYRVWHHDTEYANDLRWSYTQLRNMTELSLRQKVDEALNRRFRVGAVVAKTVPNNRRWTLDGSLVEQTRIGLHFCTRSGCRNLDVALARGWTSLERLAAWDRVGLALLRP